MPKEAGTKGRQDRLNPLPDIGQSMTIGQIHDLLSSSDKDVLIAASRSDKHDGLQAFDGFFQVVVNQNIVVFVVILNLTAWP